jgi:hypothetical protein
MIIVVASSGSSSLDSVGGSETVRADSSVALVAACAMKATSKIVIMSIIGMMLR